MVVNLEYLQEEEGEGEQKKKWHDADLLTYSHYFLQRRAFSRTWKSTLQEFVSHVMSKVNISMLFFLGYLYLSVLWLKKCFKWSHPRRNAAIDDKDIDPDVTDVVHQNPGRWCPIGQQHLTFESSKVLWKDQKLIKIIDWEQRFHRGKNKTNRSGEILGSFDHLFAPKKIERQEKWIRPWPGFNPRLKHGEKSGCKSSIIPGAFGICLHYSLEHFQNTIRLP